MTVAGSSIPKRCFCFLFLPSNFSITLGKICLPQMSMEACSRTDKAGGSHWGRCAKVNWILNITQLGWCDLEQCDAWCLFSPDTVINSRKCYRLLNFSKQVIELFFEVKSVATTLVILQSCEWKTITVCGHCLHQVWRTVSIQCRQHWQGRVACLWRGVAVNTNHTVWCLCGEMAKHFPHVAKESA